MAQRKHKYGAKPVVIDNIRFASTAEGNRYLELKLMKQAGLIEDLQLQPRFQLRVNDVLITTYIADFRYKDRETGEWVVEDVKGVLTDVYKIKRKLMQVLHGIEIREVRA